VSRVHSERHRRGRDVSKDACEINCELPALQVGCAASSLHGASLFLREAAFRL